MCNLVGSCQAILTVTKNFQSLHRNTPPACIGVLRLRKSSNKLENAENRTDKVRPKVFWQKMQTVSSYFGYLLERLLTKAIAFLGIPSFTIQNAQKKLFHMFKYKITIVHKGNNNIVLHEFLFSLVSGVLTAWLLIRAFFIGSYFLICVSFIPQESQTLTALACAAQKSQKRFKNMECTA